MRLAILALISTALFAQPDVGSQGVKLNFTLPVLQAFQQAGCLFAGWNPDTNEIRCAGQTGQTVNSSPWPNGVPASVIGWTLTGTDADGVTHYLPGSVAGSPGLTTGSAVPAARIIGQGATYFHTTGADSFAAPQVPQSLPGPMFAPQSARGRVMQSLQSQGLTADVTPVVAAGLIYQAAAAQGFNYIAPVSGQAIVAKRAGLDWRNMLTTLAADAPLAVLLTGLAGAVKIGTNAELGLGGFHGYYDSALGPYLKGEAPNPNDIDPVLQMNATVSPSAVSCQGNSMYATFDYKHPPHAVTVSVQGILVAFSPQGVAVLRNISGKLIKQFQVIHVLSCVDPGTGGSVVVTPTASLDRYPPRDTPSLRIPPAGFLNTAELTGL